jgi:L-ascorbate metabolism protein UlaG (beta-lactamase superfamily)
MKITFIGHSGFLLEWEACCWLFDYYKGRIPAMDPKKKIIVFASHAHRDHFNPDIFRLTDKYPDLTFVLSSDIELPGNDGERVSASAGQRTNILSAAPSSDYELFDAQGGMIRCRTLRSTDCGVAFLLQYRGKTVYHAGDLNLWVWKEESKEYNDHMTEMFQKEMDTLKDVSIDFAFAPLDPRLEEYYSKGVDILLNTAKVRYLFPMHFWRTPQVTGRYIREKSKDTNNTEVMEILQNGQIWEMEE